MSNGLSGDFLLPSEINLLPINAELLAAHFYQL
jgi:hypothetical protein